MPELEVTPEHAADPYTRAVGILVGVVGILLSVVTIASHRAHTDAVIHRTESNDAWAYYQGEKIQADAKAKDDESDVEEVRALRFDIGEGLLELGLVLCSLYFLARKSFFPIFGVLAAVAGTAVGIWGFLL